MYLSDTIHDLIVDTVGAAVVSIAGWRYLARAGTSYVDNGRDASSSETRRSSAISRTALSGTQ